jgi:P-type Cu2+ transporter
MHERHDAHKGMKHREHGGPGGGSHHAHMVGDFRNRFWISLIVTIPILFLSPMLQSLLGFREVMRFPGDAYVLWSLSSVIFLYGGWPFLKGILELAGKQPAMTTLIAIAITTAYACSSIVVFGLEGKVFFWELATLIDIMLLGHWIEMKSVQVVSYDRGSALDIQLVCRAVAH